MLDEMVVVPLGVIAARKMIPGEVFDECRERSREIMKEGKRPMSHAVAVLVIAVWLLMAALGAFLALRAARELGVGT